MVDFGTDFDSTGRLDSKGQIATVSGHDNVKQAVRNRLLTELDTYIEWCDDYGSTLRDLFQRPLDENNIEWIKTEIRLTVLKEPRVASCEVEYTLGVGFLYRYRLIGDDNEYTENVRGVE